MHGIFFVFDAATESIGALASAHEKIARRSHDDALFFVRAKDGVVVPAASARKNARLRAAFARDPLQFDGSLYGPDGPLDDDAATAAVRAAARLIHDFGGTADEEGSAAAARIDEALRALDGDFAFVSYDARSGSLAVARDPLGVRPLFCGFAADERGEKRAAPVVAFASDAKALVGLAGVAGVREFPPDCWWSSSTRGVASERRGYGDVASERRPAPRSPERAARLAEAARPNQKPPSRGGASCVRGGRMSTQLTPGPVVGRGLGYAADGRGGVDAVFEAHAAEVRDVLLRAVRKRVCRRRPVAVLCSGGVDSCAIASLAYRVIVDEQRRPPADLRLFTVDYESNGEDATYAALFAGELPGVEHVVVRFDRADLARVLPLAPDLLESCDPAVVRAAVPTLLLAEASVASCPEAPQSVVLSGEGADEASVSDSVSDSPSSGLLPVVLSGEGADEAFMGLAHFRHAPKEDGGAAAAREAVRLVRDLCAADAMRAERCFAARGVEARFPFLDADLVRRVLAMPASVRSARRDAEKALLRHAMKDEPGMLAPRGSGRILSRPAERMVDGCGFAYVPQLLRLLDPDVAALRRIESASERERYVGWLSDPRLATLVPDREPPPPWAVREVPGMTPAVPPR